MKSVVKSGANQWTAFQRLPTCHLLVWGDNSQRKIGFKGLPEGLISKPTYVPALTIKIAACTRTGLIFTADDQGNMNCWGKEWSRVTIPKQLRSKPIIGISCGDKHTLILSSDGVVFSWGNNSYFQLGHGSQRSDRDDEVCFGTSPKPVAALMNVFVAKVHASKNSSSIITDQDELYVWGDNTNHQLFNKLDTTIQRPLKVLPNLCILEVSISATHSLVLDLACSVYGSGPSSKGQLGDSTKNKPVYDILRTTQESEKGLPVAHQLWLGNKHQKKVIAVRAGTDFSVLLTSQGQVFTSGINKNGCLGLGLQEGVSVAEFTPVELSGHISRIIVDDFTTHAFSDHPKCYSWGMNNTNQLGPQIENQYVSSPTELTLDEDVDLQMLVHSPEGNFSIGLYSRL